MLFLANDLELIGKYLTPTGADTYRVKDTHIPQNAKERLMELDEMQVLSYGYHMIEDFEEQ